MLPVFGSVEVCGLQLIGNRSLVTELGPLFVASAAAIAAWLAARFAHTRQKEQLAHDSDRQKEQLAHDRDRQKEQLAHDRELRAIDHGRDVLDRVFEGAIKAIRTSVVLESTIKVREGGRNEAKDRVDAAGQSEPDQAALALLNETNERFKKVIEASHQSLIEMRLETWRLRIRFGRNGEIAKAHKSLVDSLGEVHKSYASARTERRGEDDIEASKAVVAGRKQAFNAFVDTCEEWLKEPLK